jgi:hypothetical protein
MAFKPAETFPGVIDFTNIDTAAKVQPGFIVRGIDTASGQGAGEFIYLPGISGGTQFVGALVTYNPLKPSTSLATGAGALHNAIPLAVAMSAVTTAANYGWSQITGVATMKKTAVKVNPNVPIFVSATNGRITAAAASGKQVLDAVTVNAATVASATSTVQVLLNRPCSQSQVI